MAVPQLLILASFFSCPVNAAIMPMLHHSFKPFPTAVTLSSQGRVEIDDSRLTDAASLSNLPVTAVTIPPDDSAAMKQLMRSSFKPSRATVVVSSHARTHIHESSLLDAASSVQSPVTAVVGPRESDDLPVANGTAEDPTMRPKSLRILTVFDKTFADAGMLGLWQACGRRALGEDGFDEIVDQCQFDVVLADIGNAANFQEVESIARGSCKPRQAVSFASGIENIPTRTMPPPPTPVSLLSGVESLPPRTMTYYLMYKLLSYLESGVDVLHIDADAFMLNDPVQLMAEKYPEADIIATPDCANNLATPGCWWYRNDVLKLHKDGKDPLGERGFMLNTGFMLLRNRAAVLRLIRDSIELMKIDGTNEQIGVNEVLATRTCTWTYENGAAFPLNGSAFVSLAHRTVYGRCASPLASGNMEKDLRLVVMPYAAVPRGWDHINYTTTLAYHPGGSLTYKKAAAKQVEEICQQRSKSKQEP